MCRNHLSDMIAVLAQGVVCWGLGKRAITTHANMAPRACHGKKAYALDLESAWLMGLYHWRVVYVALVVADTSL